jgi:hypothetical protein
MGSSGIPVTLTIHNSTDEAVRYYAHDSERYNTGKQPDYVLGPGDSTTTGWLVPIWRGDNAETVEYKKRHVLYSPIAFDERGNVAFHRSYNWYELDAEGWRVEIRQQ